MNYPHSDITEIIIKNAYLIHQKLGYGFLEKVYENALLIELQKSNLKVESQKSIQVNYEGEIIGDYFADIVVENKVIVELKAVERISKINEVQLVNYLKASKIEVGLLINFGKSVEIKRKIFTGN